MNAKTKTYLTTRTVIWTTLCLLVLLQALLACNTTTVKLPNNDNEPAVFTDADIDAAEISLATETLDIADLDSEDLDAFGSDLEAQARIRGASGYVYFIGDDPDTSNPWRIKRFNQSIVDKSIVYRGERQIQAVAGTLDGNTLIVSMKETSQASSDYEIYKLVIDPPSVKKLTSNNVDDINVSMSKGSKRKVWESSVGGKATVYLRIGTQETAISHSNAQREPSISGNGKYIALIREIATGEKIKVYKISSDTYENVPTADPAQVKHSPSVSDAGNKVLWLEPGATNKIKLINLTTNTTTEEVSSTKGLNHPNLTADGYWFGYSKELIGSGGWRIFTKNIPRGVTRKGTTLPNDVDHTGAYWQKSNLFPNEIKKVAFDGKPNDRFGSSVAIDGSTMVVGASFHSLVYILEQADGEWVFVTKLLASDRAADDYFGSSVAISGNTVVVGAAGNDDNGEDSGSAYIYKRNQGGTNNWGEVKKLLASDGAEDDRFGNSVAISGDTVVVGAYRDDYNSSSSGSAYIFERDKGGNDNWGEAKKLLASDGRPRDNFGRSVSISGSTLVIGARGIYYSYESAYIFERDQGGTNNWGEVKKLLTKPNNGFGYSVAISGSTVVIGADDDDDNGDSSGSVYIFEQDKGGTNNWGKVKKILASDGADGDNLGLHVAISGSTVVVSAIFDDDHGRTSGSAYMFERDEGGINNWGEVKKLLASDGAAGDFFGVSVAISGDTVVIGASLDDNDNGEISGSVYIYQ